MHTTTIEFDDIIDDRFGGKALGLAELTRLGLSVPTGFVIADASAQARCPTTVTDSVLRAGCHRATPVAVRSSAAGEDGDEQSFAGQYDTVLGVGLPEDFAAAVAPVRRLGRVPNAPPSYGGAEPRSTMHVVVQQMVDARAAGVVFTADPTTGRRDLMVIDAIAGLGEALVDGTAVLRPPRADLGRHPGGARGR